MSPSGQCQGHHPDTRSYPPGHHSPPENREPADRIYGHSISKRAVDLAERQGIGTVVSTMALHYFLTMGACDIDLHLTHWDPGKISSNWELMFNFNVWLKIPYIFIVNSDEIISKHPSWQRSGPRLNIKTVLSTYGDFHVKDKTAVRTSYL